MKKPVGYLSFSVASKRLEVAQEKLEKSILDFALEGVPYLAGPKLVPIANVLWKTREHASGTGFVWCNTDVIITRDPFDVPDPDCVYGFHRREVPSGRPCGGIDMFYIPIKWWDSVLVNDVPDLLIGASYVDWWVPRAMGKRNRYSTLDGYIDHPSHAQSQSANSDANGSYQHNFRAFNKWAKRNQLDPIQAPPFLVPFVGHVWGVRDLMNKLIRASRGM